MKNHSLKAELKTRATEELDSMLAYCLREENYANHADTICAILEVLHEREYQETLPEETEVRRKPWQGEKRVLRPVTRLLLKLRCALGHGNRDDFFQ